MKWESRLRHRNSWVLSLCCQSKNLISFHIFWFHSRRQFPGESMQHVGQANKNHLRPKGIARAHSSPRTKRQQLKVMSFNVNSLTEEPFRPEIFRIFPQIRVSTHAPGVNEDSGSFRDVIATNFAILKGQMRCKHDSRWMHPHCLFHYSFYVRKLGDVLLLHPSISPNNSIQFVRYSFE
ncbi:hypothetical protein NC651_016199 [Populus alba x Populus x berolinensis]|nr:hypothetical protein NC651_016199 [Populus alba x Populus x berolinensis]